MKEEMQRVYIASFLVLVGIIAFVIVIQAASKVGLEREKTKQHEKCTAQIAQMQRTQGNHAQWIQENTNGLIALNAELVGDGSEGYYDFELEDSYGIDEIPTIP